MKTDEEFKEIERERIQAIKWICIGSLIWIIYQSATLVQI